MKFSELGLIAPILKALDSQGYTTPTPIQRQAISPALAGRDVLGCAQTGTGKTCAFATPILQRLNETVILGHRPIRALILTPTRELALQIEENIEAYGKHLPLRSAVIFGGVGQQPQVDKIKRGLDILVATPGRLLDLQGQGLLDLSKVEIFVLDEADRMLDMGFIHDVKRVLKVLPKEKQTLFFSATMPPEVMDLVNGLLHNPVKVAVDPVSSPVEVIEQGLYMVDKGNKNKLLASIIKAHKSPSTLVFTRTKHGANKVVAELVKSGITAAAIHGNKSQTARQQALSDFKSGKITALVATDIAARGIDIEELPLVVNYNLPEVPETYVHRIGRTGRAGHEGTALSFCDFAEKAYLKGIEKLIGKKIPQIDHDWPMEIFTVAKTNSDDQEARQAARERKAARQAAQKPQGNRQAQAKLAREAKEAEARLAKEIAQAEAALLAKQEKRAKKNAPRWQKRQGGENTLDSVLPERTAGPSRNTAEPLRGYRNPLAEDRIMDATARLLAPKRPAQPKAQAKPQPKAKPAQKPQAQAQKPQSNRSAGTASNNNNNSNNGNKNNRRGNFGRGRGPMPVTLRTDGVKDSTEQESLMKPYYMND